MRRFSFYDFQCTMLLNCGAMKPLLRFPGFRRKNERAGNPAAPSAAPFNVAPDAALSGKTLANAAPDASSSTELGASLEPMSGVRKLPRPALRWVGNGHRTALREFDFAADGDAVCAWQQETYSLNFPDFRFTDSFAAAFRHDLRRAALDPHHGIFVLDEGELSGFLWLVVCENTWTGERYGYVNNLYLTPQRRGAGLARELMQQAEKWFRERGIKRARLTVTTSNAAACRLYENCGYSTTRWEMEKEL